jgi:ribosomal subunit interface protein
LTADGGAPNSFTQHCGGIPLERKAIASMQLTVTGKQVEIGDALRAHVESSLNTILAKYFKTAIEAHVVVGREAHLIRAEISLRIGRGIVVNAHASLDDAAAAFDAAAQRVAKQMRRYKRRLRQHHARSREAVEPVEQVRDAVLAPLDDEADDEGVAEAETVAADEPAGAPAVIAEISAELPRLTVGEAAMRLDLADLAVLLFRNSSHDELNLVYRRTDGNIGWVDPVLDPARRAPGAAADN